VPLARMEPTAAAAAATAEALRTWARGVAALRGDGELEAAGALSQMQQQRRGDDTRRQQHHASKLRQAQDEERRKAKLATRKAERRKGRAVEL
jgi:hypothetical protein